jgi:hypothetical protein
MNSSTDKAIKLASDWWINGSPLQIVFRTERLFFLFLGKVLEVNAELGIVGFGTDRGRFGFDLDGATTELFDVDKSRDSAPTTFVRGVEITFGDISKCLIFELWSESDFIVV